MRYGIRGFGERLDESIRDADMSYSDVYKKVGIAQNTLYGYIYNSYVPNGKILAKLSALLDVSTDWLLGLSEKKRLSDK